MLSVLCPWVSLPCKPCHNMYKCCTYMQCVSVCVCGHLLFPRNFVCTKIAGGGAPANEDPHLGVNVPACLNLLSKLFTLLFTEGLTCFVESFCSCRPSTSYRRAKSRSNCSNAGASKLIELLRAWTEMCFATGSHCGLLCDPFGAF